MRITDIPEFDYLIFENRNREYGAYDLRKKYNSAVIGGIIIAILIAFFSIVLPFIIKPSSEKVLTVGGRFAQVRMESLEPPPEEIYIPPAPPPPMESSQQEIVKYVPPVVVDSVILNEPAPLTTDEALAQTNENQAETGINGTGEDLLSGGDGYGTEEPYFIVETMPTFRGGDINNFRSWVQLRTNYPEEAIEKKIQGRVSLTFIVEPDGTVSNVTVIKGVDPLIDNEAVKSIQSSPKWSPGLQRGQPVRVRFLIWLNFVP
jgi:periplasmic protein TonB